MSMMSKIDDSLSPPPIFVIGYSRSGTTLTYQCIVQSFNLAYFPNWFFKFVIGRIMFSEIIKKIGGFNCPPNFSSRYGLTQKWNGPNSGSIFWMRAFKDHRGRQTTRLTEKKEKELQRYVFFLSNLCAAPFAAKWTPLSVRVSSLKKVFPDAVFIRVRRDKDDVIYSCLKSALEVHGTYEKTLSTWPKEFPMTGNSSPKENLGQHYELVNREIDRHLKQTIRDRYFEIDYESFCQNPQLVISNFAEFYSSITGINLHIVQTLPASFRVSRHFR